ncbi:MAG TPA: hypothetical protein VFB59_03815 [Candidatus Saccharimonadales bacterium]|nr:hypothetical protein [Candidatus Saccharimonadales bacterium]
MRKLRVLFSSLAISLVAAVGIALPASAAPNTKLDLVQDCSTGCSEAVDMAGPTGFGFINYNQDDEGNLRVVASLKNAEPNTTYQIFLVCGPTHAAACGFIEIGTLTTNGQGNGNSGAVMVPLATLQSAPFGAGARTDHIDLLAGGTGAGVYATSNVDYLVP